MKAKKFLVSATAFMTALLSAVLFVGCQKKEPAQADYPYYANSREIYDASDVIIIGKITTAGSVRNLNVYEDSGKTEKYTVSSVEILQVIKGDVNVGDVIEVKQLGDKEHPETELAEKAGIQVERGIVTDFETMQTSNSDIYAAGDCTVSNDMLDGSKKIIALWVNAVQQGRVAGSRMAGGSESLGGSFAVNAIDFYGLRICTCGLINASGEQYRDVIKHNDDKYKRLIFEGNKLVGFVLINSSENAGIYTSLIENQTDITELIGDITQTPSLFMFEKAVRQSKLKGELE